MFESVNGRTDGRTPARLVYYKLTLLASGSGELKIENLIFMLILCWFYAKRFRCESANR